MSDIKRVIDKIAGTKIEFNKDSNGKLDLELHVPADKVEMCTITNKQSNHAVIDVLDAIIYGIKKLEEMEDDFYD